MNSLWKQLGELKEVSEIIFADDPEIKALFALPKPSPKSHDDEMDNGEVNEVIDLDDETITE